LERKNTFFFYIVAPFTPVIPSPVCFPLMKRSNTVGVFLEKIKGIGLARWHLTEKTDSPIHYFVSEEKTGYLSPNIKRRGKFVTF